MAFTLEQILTSERCFGLVKATPLQRLLCRAIDGLPFDDLVEANPELLEAFEGGASPLDRTFGLGGAARLPGKSPLEIYLLTGIRTGKSLLCAAIAFQCGMQTDLSILQPWEEPVVSVVSISKKKARIIMRHLVGPMLARPHLRALLPREPTTETIWIRRPHDGRIVRIEVAAGARAGGALVGDWSAGVLFDEFPRMLGEEDGSVINFDENRNAVIGRILPGGHLVGVGSPWAPRGPAFEIVKNHYGAPSEDVVVLRPPARLMHPAYWTDAKIDRLRKSPKGEHVYTTDYLGEFADKASNFFGWKDLQAVTRIGIGELEPVEGAAHFAAMDPAMQRNAWTLVIARREYDAGGAVKVVIVFAKQWVPSRDGTLNPDVVLAEIKAACARYGVWEVWTDRWKFEDLERRGSKLGLTVSCYGLAGNDNVEIFEALKVRVLTKGIEFPDDPEIRTDLLGVRRIVTNRSARMEYPFTTDGRHCDYAPAIAVVNALAAAGTSWLDAMDALERRGKGNAA